MPRHWRKDNFLTRDISRPFSSVVALVALLLIGSLWYYRGVSGAVFAAEYLAGLGALVAIYLTYLWQWPRLVRFVRDLWRNG